MTYWEANRDKRKKSIWQYSFGLPLGVMIVVALFVNIATGWYKRADMELRSNASLIIVVLIAAIAIVVFISIFTSRYQWEQNEQRYLELKNKEAKQKNSTNSLEE